MVAIAERVGMHITDMSERTSVQGERDSKPSWTMNRFSFELAVHNRVGEMDPSYERRFAVVSGEEDCVVVEKTDPQHNDGYVVSFLRQPVDNCYKPTLPQHWETRDAARQFQEIYGILPLTQDGIHFQVMLTRDAKNEDSFMARLIEHLPVEGQEDGTVRWEPVRGEVLDWQAQQVTVHLPQIPDYIRNGERLPWPIR